MTKNTPYTSNTPGVIQKRLQCCILLEAAILKRNHNDFSKEIFFEKFHTFQRKSEANILDYKYKLWDRNFLTMIAQREEHYTLVHADCVL